MKNKAKTLLVGNVPKSEMAMKFYSDVCPESALKSFMRLINNDEVLLHRLVKETHYRKNSHRFTPRQQEIIVERLGEPGLRHENSHVRIAELSRESSRTLT